MAQPFLGEIRLFSFSFAPKGWALCNGQLMPINQNQALFSLLGTMYGGNGQTTFALPDLRGRIPLHFDGSFSQGSNGGEENHTLLSNEMPTHTHSAVASSIPANTASPANAFWADGAKTLYMSSANTGMAPGTVSSVGGNQPHGNWSPYLVINFCIALQGIFPSRN